MRLGYNTNGFAHHRLEDALEIIANLGYEAVAITPDIQHLDPFRDSSAAEVDRVRRRLEDLRLVPVIETGARYLLDPRTKHEPTLVSADDAGRRRRFDFLARCLELAGALGAKVVSLWSGRLAGSLDREAALGWLADGCRRLADRADALGLDLAFEPEPGMFVESMADFARLAAKVAHPRFRLTIDLGHLLLTEPAPLSRVLVDWAGSLANVHVEDMKRPVHEHLMFGEGELPVGELLATLGEIDFPGVVSVELSRHSHAAPESAARAIAYLRARLQKQPPYGRAR